ncbi:MAG TPA: 2-C-methyl-D-erythritol 2,4-cyclodiphosphate synthase [Actinomycetota bacterium]|nr:2-C-methyl-D-erythritol 2,4-cyclodiphosphate synthase [Actinomycetota bacterium]
MRAGIGFDVHRYDAGRPLVLGGVELAGCPGLSGHSDADVLSHAIADALLGAACLGDLGTHFPDTDDRWKDIGGTALLRNVRDILAEARMRPVNVDATLLLEEPKIAPHAPAMRRNIAAALGLRTGEVSVKATTAEGLGTVGRREGAACMAVAMVESTTVA